MTDKPASPPASEEKKATTPPATAAPASKKSRRRRRARGSNTVNLILFLLFMAAMAALAWWIEKQEKELAVHTRYQIDQLRKEIEPALQRLESTSKDLQTRLSVQEQRQQDFDEAFQTLLKTRRHLRNDWLLAEADYLMRLASQRLLLARDTGTALAALQTADERLREMADPAVIPLREQLAADIGRLKAVAQPDITGLAARLGALVQAVDSLPLRAEYVVQKPKDTTAEAPQTVANWQQLPEAIWRDIKKLLVIRERHGKVMPLISPEQHFFLVQNLKLQLEQARLALLDAEPDIYRERLQAAATWVREFFRPDDPATSAMLGELEQLAGQDIKPALPDISASYRALRDFRERQAETAAGGDAS